MFPILFLILTGLLAVIFFRLKSLGFIGLVVALAFYWFVFLYLAGDSIKMLFSNG